MMYHIELLLNGLMVGALYSLIALGFVLIYKASDVINFAQGELVMFAGYIVAASLQLYGLPLLLAILLGLGGMILLGYLVETIVLQHLVGRPVVAIIMATIGLASFLQGLAPFFWGIETKNIPLPISDEPLFLGDILLNRIEVIAGGLSLVLFGVVGWLFTKSRTGIALRAIADDQQVSLA
ncbi:MAG TPA: branched-chain amino acid ABC transporter permease, partial [bacterium]